MKIYLRDIQEKDLDRYYYWKHPSREFHKYNWPYFKKDTEKELKTDINKLMIKLKNWKRNILENKKLIVDKENEELIWEVNRYRKSKETYWMEIWIVIFNENYRWQWLWTIALSLRIENLFKKNKHLVRLWLTTRSGNIGMIKLAEKLWFKKEAKYRKARIVNWKYYDSLSYGILREERELIKKSF